MLLVKIESRIRTSRTHLDIAREPKCSGLLLGPTRTAYPAVSVIYCSVLSAPEGWCLATADRGSAQARGFPDPTVPLDIGHYRRALCRAKIE